MAKDDLGLKINVSYQVSPVERLVTVSETSPKSLDVEVIIEERRPSKVASIGNIIPRCK